MTIAGRTWILPAYMPASSPIWDDLCRDGNLAGRYDPPDVLAAATRLIQENYELSTMEAAELVQAADISELVKAVENALYGMTRPERTLTEWVEYSLRANGLDPGAIHPSKHRGIIEYLAIASGGKGSTPKIVPESVYVTAVAQGSKRRAAQQMVKAQAVRRVATPPPGNSTSAPLDSPDRGFE